MDQNMIPVRDMHGCAIFRNHLSPPHMHINGGHDIQEQSRNKETSRTISKIGLRVWAHFILTSHKMNTHKQRMAFHFHLC